MSQNMDTIRLGELCEDPNLAAQWRDLASKVPGASYFQTPHWIKAWWYTIADRPDGAAALVWDTGSLLGVMPLARTREVVTSRLPMRFTLETNAGTGIGTDHAGWLAHHGAEALLSKWTSERNMLLRGVSVEQGRSLGGRAVESYACPQLVLSEWPERMSSKLAKTLRNAQRRLADDGVRFTWKPPGDVEYDDLNALYSLHALRRSETGDPSVFTDPKRRLFHERLLEAGTDPKGGTAVMVAATEDRVVGVLYGFVWQDTFAYYQIGWEPEYHRWSLGSVLVLEAIEACKAAGLEVFDFLRGADSYKYRFGATDVHEGSFILGRSLGLRTMEAASRMRGARSSGRG